MAKRKNGVQSLLGFERFTRYGVKTDKGEVVLFAVEPTNISVMSKTNVEIKVHSLMMVLSVIPDLQIIAIDSAERFDSNKAYMFKRLESEQNEAVRKLLMADIEHLDEIQLEMSSARQFMFALSFKKEKPEQIFNTLNRVEKTLSEHGFTAKRMSKPETKRMLALYFGSSLTGDEIPDVEGENEFKMEVKE